MSEFREFLPPEIEKEIKKEKEEKEKSSLQELGNDLAEELKKPGLLEKLRGSKFLPRLVFLTAFLIGAETFGQDKEKRDASVKSAKEAVHELISQLEQSKDTWKGEVRISGYGHSKALEQNIGTKKIHKNDYYFYIRDEENRGGKIRTTYGVDFGHDGTVDQIVVVPGQVNKADDEDIVNTFVSKEPELFSIEMSTASMGRYLHDRPALNRLVYFVDQKGDKWYEANFSNGEIQELQNDTMPQAWWEAKTVLTAAEVKEKK